MLLGGTSCCSWEILALPFSVCGWVRPGICGVVHRQASAFMVPACMIPFLHGLAQGSFSALSSASCLSPTEITRRCTYICRSLLFFLKERVKEDMAWTPRPYSTAPALRSKTRGKRIRVLCSRIIPMTDFQLQKLFKEAECTQHVNMPSASSLQGWPKSMCLRWENPSQSPNVAKTLISIIPANTGPVLSVKDGLQFILIIFNPPILFHRWENETQNSYKAI